MLALSLSVVASLLYAASAQLPTLPIAPSLTGWAQAGSAACGKAYCGDIRAVLSLTPSDISGNAATVQVFWRRRDPNPQNKSLIVTDASGAALTVTAAAIASDCGVVTFSRAGLSPGTYYLYYLPFNQGSGGAWLTFNWQGCSDTSADESNICVQGRRLAGGDMCAAATAAAAPVVRLETRNAFNSFTDMELLATAGEAGATAAALAALPAPAPWVGVFPETRDRPVRVFDPLLTPGRPIIPSRWALGGGGPQPTATPSLTVTGAPGEWVAVQLGLWAYAGPVANVSYSATPFGALPASAFTVINLEGSDVYGIPFVNPAYALGAGAVGSLWCGLLLPPSAAPGDYAGTVTLTSPGRPGIAVRLTFTVLPGVAPVPFGGAGNLTAFTRLPWLNSQRGLEDTVPQPFVAMNAGPGGGGAAFSVASLNKVIEVGPNGLPMAITSTYKRVRKGVPSPVQHSVLQAPVEFTLLDAAGAPPTGPPAITSPAALYSTSNSSLKWGAQWALAFASGARAVLSGNFSFDFTSYLNAAITITNPSATAPLALGDVQLTVAMPPSMAAYIVGMDNGGAQGREYVDRQWRWTPTTGANKLWWGRPEAGLLLNLKGEGIEWDSPMFGADYPVVPFLPPTWAGVAQASGAYGVNVTSGTAVAFSGPRTLAPGESVRFLFDLALTPSKPQDWTRHWATRTRQLGYDVPYASPQAVAAMGVTVVTLHQGTPGIVNGSLINPWINYPFGSDVTPLLTNFTAQANALGVAVKFYYTIRELSARAAEMFALFAMQGEILVDQNPYTIVQPGYGHQWDNHGGAAYLHQHYGSHYGACWQQAESNGEVDPSMCSRGVSRLFNFYVEGLYWSFMQPPYINGIYYDGTNFPREGMIRIRRAADAASAAAGKGFRPFLDVHTGREGTPDTCSYATHYPLMDYFWDGEGFDWSQNSQPPYWLLETSLTIHGMTGDMLGSGAGNIFKGMVFGMTMRDADTSQAIWKFWDATSIAATDAHFAWWMVDADGPAVNVSFAGQQGVAAPAAPYNCTWQVSQDKYYGSQNEPGCFYPPQGPTAGCWPSGHTLEDFKAACCGDVECLGFSYNPSQSSGCCKRNLDGPFSLAGEMGFVRQGGPPPPPCATLPLASVWSKFGSHAIVAVASWCPSAVNITLALDWAALGMDASTARAELPDIAGVQAGMALNGAEGPFELKNEGGLLMHITAA